MHDATLVAKWLVQVSPIIKTVVIHLTVKGSSKGTCLWYVSTSGSSVLMVEGCLVKGHENHSTRLIRTIVCRKSCAS